MKLGDTNICIQVLKKFEIFLFFFFFFFGEVQYLLVIYSDTAYRYEVSPLGWNAL